MRWNTETLSVTGAVAVADASKEERCAPAPISFPGSLSGPFMCRPVAFSV